MAGKSKRFLIGCGIGCGTLLLLGVSSCVGFTVWLNQPGELLEPTRLLAPATIGYLEWTLDGDDPGTAAFVEAMIEQTQANARQPQGWSSILQRVVARGQKQNEENFREMLPVVLVWSMQADPEAADDLHVLGISVERLGNRMRFMDWSLGMMLRANPDVETLRYGDEKVFVVEDSENNFGFFVRDRTVFVTSGAESAKRALDRLRTPVAAVASEVGNVYGALPDTAIRGVVSNADGALAGIWETIAGAPDGALREQLDWGAIDMVTLTGGLSGPTSFEVLFELHCRDPEWATTHAESFVTALRTDYRRSHLPVETDVTVAGNRIQVILSIDDVRAFLDEF